MNTAIFEQISTGLSALSDVLSSGGVEALYLAPSFPLIRLTLPNLPYLYVCDMSTSIYQLLCHST